MRKLLPIALLLLALPLFAALGACGGDDDDGDSEAPEVTTPAADDDGGGDDSDGADGGDGEDDGGGGGGGGDADSYYSEMEDIATATDTALEEIGDRLSSLSEDDPEYVDQIREAFADAGRVLESALLAVADLDPPAAAADAHEEFMADLQGQTANFAAFHDDLQDIETVDELNALFADYDPIFTQGDEAFADSCNALQDLADEAGADVDLKCDPQ